MGVFSNEPCPFGVRPGGVKADAKQQDVGPVDDERGAKGEEVGEQPRRERQHGDDGEKNEIEPGQVAVGALKLVERRLLADPEDTERHQAEEPGHQPRRGGPERAEQLRLGMDVGGVGRAKVEHQHRRGKGEYSVAQRFDSADVAAGEAIVMHLHRATIAMDAARGQPGGPRGPVPPAA